MFFEVTRIISIQILTAHKGNGEKLLSGGEIQPWPTYTTTRLNFTEGAITFHHTPNKRAVNICFIHPIDFLVRIESARLSSSKFGSCNSFFEIQGNSKN